MDVFEGKTKRYHEQLTKLAGNKVLRSRSLAAMFAVSFANFLTTPRVVVAVVDLYLNSVKKLQL